MFEHILKRRHALGQYKQIKTFKQTNYVLLTM